MDNVRVDRLQALILTKNEEPNIKRVLDKLTWMDRVVVLDSYSTDKTIDILRGYSNVEVHYRKFDSFAQQCNYGLELLTSKWVLSLDADYVLTNAFISETKSIVNDDADNNVGYFTRFEFLVFGHQLTSNNTTPRAVLFKKGEGSYFDDGHAHRLQINGPTGNYKAKILHDDRKSLSRWLSNQDGYSVKECHKLLEPGSRLSFSSKIRKNKVIAPFFVFFYSLFVKGLILDGWAGWHYTLQRTMVEILMAIRLIEEEKLKKDSK
ncbi:glycosyltransferase family 2 protein [Mucilaginibacter daejeonensis]|uniref:glycosyltransferase family 2 protein n=1 Tax=Mucilaginibacter daejeonensis TaxID=398049 RepID=UPI001D178788|nr:glycosyltransferase family 2 protein [Mucilaginibacter daejeonensis]UEG52648.1 glycosyltransferase family 2 protein [Mucilaginibacter daejeonensis]